MCQVCNLNPTSTLDDERASAFEQRFIGALNDAAMVTMASVGHRTGLFDAMSAAPGLTSVELADRARLNERYVREWLGAMVAAGVVEIDAGTNAAASTYRLPTEHARFLTRSAPANLAVIAQFMPLLGSVEDDVVGCFHAGGGVPYSRYGRFHEVMAEESAQTVLPALESAILPLVPGLIDQLRTGIRVLDVGCGRGGAMIELASRFPMSHFTGYDLSEEAIRWAQDEAQARGLSNASFEIRDLSDFDISAPVAAFDLVTTFDAIHDQAKPQAVVRGVRRALADGGVYLAQDIKGEGRHDLDRTNPIATVLYTISCMHCMTVSLAQGGDGLGAMWGRELAERFFCDAGFRTTEVHELAHDIQNYYYVCRP